MAATNHKRNGGRPAATADSSGGLDLLGSLSPDAPRVVVIGQTESQSGTDKAGADSTSSASALQVLGNDVGGSAACGSQGVDNEGADRDEDQGGPLDAEDSLTIDLDPAPVSLTVLSASCESRAVQANNASSSARASVLEADVAGTGIVVLGSSSSTKTTSGQAGSGQTESSFTVASVGDTTVLGCSSYSKTTKGTSEDGSSVTVLGQDQDAECPLTTASTTFEQSNE